MGSSKGLHQGTHQYGKAQPQGDHSMQPAGTSDDWAKHQR